MADSRNLPICVACGTQFDAPADGPPTSCRICDDPRQFLPPTGQTWTTLSTLLSGNQHRNSFTPIDFSAHPNTNSSKSPTASDVAGSYKFTSIATNPKFAIGQRCILVETPSRENILWDCISYLDRETVDFIKGKGGLKAIVISHPHYYSTHLEWAREFGCQVWTAGEDEEWFCRGDGEGRRRFLKSGEGVNEEVVKGVTAIKTGGHFPGSLVLLCGRVLLIADSFVTIPSALYHIDRLPGTTSYTFMYAVPNMIPLPPSELLKMWTAIKPFDFGSTHGAFVGQEVIDAKAKARVLESMQIQTKGMGWTEHEILRETAG